MRDKIFNHLHKRWHRIHPILRPAVVFALFIFGSWLALITNFIIVIVGLVIFLYFVLYEELKGDAER